jgi:hypothetical protein
MARAKRLAMLIASSIAASATLSPDAGAANSQGQDYGISHDLAENWPACIKAPIDGVNASDGSIYERDFGAENTPQRQAAIDAMDQMVDLGLLTRLSSQRETYRDYKVADRRAHTIRGIFCYGRETLTKVVSLSAPHSNGQFCVREAEILTKVEGVPDWLGRPSLAPYVENHEASARVSKTVELRWVDGHWAPSTPLDLPTDGPPSDACQGLR